MEFVLSTSMEIAENVPRFVSKASLLNRCFIPTNSINIDNENSNAC